MVPQVWDPETHLNPNLITPRWAMNSNAQRTFPPSFNVEKLIFVFTCELVDTSRDDNMKYPSLGVTYIEYKSTAGKSNCLHASQSYSPNIHMCQLENCITNFREVQLYFRLCDCFFNCEFAIQTKLLPRPY